MANITLGQILHTDTNEPLDVTNKALHVKVAEALPTGANIIGLVKLTDGTNAVVVDANGALKIVPVNSTGTELFTSANPGKVDVNSALPTGDNVIGRAKLTDGTNVLVVNSNGSINLVPYDSAGTELFTDANPGKVQLNGSNLEIEQLATDQSVSAGAYSYFGAPVDVKKYAKVVLYVETDASHSYDLMFYKVKDANLSNVFEPSTKNITGTKVTYSYTRESPYIQARVKNNDTVSHTYSAWLWKIVS